MRGRGRFDGAVEQAAQQVAAQVPGQLVGGPRPQQQHRGGRGTLAQRVPRVGGQAPRVHRPDRAEQLAPGAHRGGQTGQLFGGHPGEFQRALGGVQAAVVLVVLRAAGDLAAEDALPPGLVDGLAGDGRVREDLAAEVLHGDRPADGRRDGVGQREQITGQRVLAQRRRARAVRADDGRQQLEHLVPGGVPVRPEQRGTRRLGVRHRVRPVAAHHDTRHPGPPGVAHQRPRLARAHTDGEEQRARRPLRQRGVRVVQQHLGDRDGAAVRGPEQAQRGAAERVEEVSQRAGVHG